MQDGSAAHETDITLVNSLVHKFSDFEAFI